MDISGPPRKTSSLTSGRRTVADKGELRARVNLLTALLCACTIVGFVACQGDRRESFYPSLADAYKDEAVTRGWIPDFLPASSTDIHEIHDISPSTEWCAFRFLPTGSEALRKRLEEAQTDQASVKVVPSPGVPWWPSALTGTLDEKKIHDAGFDLYVLVEPETSVTSEVLLFAINWPKGRGFFYSEPAAGSQ